MEPMESDHRDMERLGAVGCFSWDMGRFREHLEHCTWILHLDSALGAALSPKFPSKKFFPQYPNENEQQKGK